MTNKQTIAQEEFYKKRWQSMSKEELEKEIKTLSGCGNVYLQGAEDDERMGYDEDAYSSRKLADKEFEKVKIINKILKQKYDTK